MFGFFSPDPTVTITINGNESLNPYRDSVLKTDLPCFTDGDKISGKLEIIPPPGKAVSHKGIILLLIGEFRRADHGESVGRFLTKRQELVPEGELRIPIKQDYSFDNVKFPCSTFKGTAINVVYSVQVLVVHRVIDFKVEQQFTALLFKQRPTETQPIHNEVGIRNILHIEFVFPSPAIDCTDALVGACYFILIKLRIVHMALTLYRQETFQSDDFYLKKKTELKTIEIMDGAPCRGDHIPIRFFLGEANLYPFEDFSKSPLKVEHYVRAVLTDENGKKYYKRLKVEFLRFKPDSMNLERKE